MTAAPSERGRPNQPPAGCGRPNPPIAPERTTADGVAPERTTGVRLRLADATWPEVEALAAAASTLLVPLGATEQHGPHLPLGTDATIAVALAAAAAAAVPGAIVAPVLPYGSSGEHQDFAGTLSIGAAATELVLVELGRSAAETFDRLLFVNAHGGNAAPVAAAVTLLREEGRDVRAWSPRFGGDAHAGRTETSLMLALDTARERGRPSQPPSDRGRPNPPIAPVRTTADGGAPVRTTADGGAPVRTTAVREEWAAAGNTAPLAELIDDLRDGGVRVVSPNGVLGDPAGASAEEGRALLAAAVEDLCATLHAWEALRVAG
ncbi:MAG: mycofactocin biosynthesis peptidyl-dipeptidase MftE [Actinobacteria bacterium]|nr:mycofactocin biosynthesis peptidyl-dipeptidase MftE [Actinomycetota bacterium]